MYLHSSIGTVSCSSVQYLRYMYESRDTRQTRAWFHWSRYLQVHVAGASRDGLTVPRDPCPGSDLRQSHGISLTRRHTHTLASPWAMDTCRPSISQVRAWGNPANIGFVSFYEEFDDNNPHHPNGVQ